jgi:PTS system galactitol-specific IIB component
MLILCLSVAIDSCFPKDYKFEEEKDMAGEKRILVACGTGVCTSTMAVNKLKDALEKRGKLKLVKINQCKIAEIASMASDNDLVVATTQVSAKINIPVVTGTAFLTGIGVDKVVEQIIDHLKI